MKRLMFFCGLILVLLISMMGMAANEDRWVKVLPDVKENEGFRITSMQEDSLGVRLGIQTPGFAVTGQTEEGTSYQAVKIPGAGISSEIGRPQLPVIRRFLQIPLKSVAEIADLTSEVQVVKDYQILPVQEPWADFRDLKKPAFRIDKDLYAKNGFYPESIVKLGRPGIIRGVQVVPVEISPMQYNPVTRELRVHHDIKFTVKHSGSASALEMLESEAAYTEQYGPMLKRMILNYQPPTIEKIKIWEKWPWPFIKLDYLIVVHDSLYEAIQPLVKAKRDKGLRVGVVKTSFINAAGPTADQIRSYIQGRYTKSFPRLSYVLLVGDTNLLPTHYRNDHFHPMELDKKVGTDFYYTTMDGENDYMPDVAVGRLPGKTPAEITTMVDKILNRETQYFQVINPKPTVARSQILPLNTYFNRALSCGYFQDANHDGQEDRPFIQTCEEIRQYLIGKKYTVRYVYTVTPGALTPAKFYNGSAITPGLSFNGTTADVVNAINQNVFLVWHRDHGDSANGPYGSSDGWGDPRFITSDLGGLTNTKYPVVFSINCRSGWFDGETDLDGGATKVDCLGEALLKRANSGAAGYIGSTRISYSHYNDAFTKGMIDCLWPDFISTYDGETSNYLGIALNYAKFYVAEEKGAADFNSYNYTALLFEEFNLLGDPEMAVKGRRYFIKPIFPKVIPYKQTPYLDRPLQ